MRERPPGSGRWQPRAFVGVDELTGKPLQVTKTFVGTEAKAKVALGRFVTGVADGKFEPNNATVGQLLDKWLKASAVSQRPRTREENRRKIEHRIRPVLGSVRLNKL
jgi:Phage integrase, N-terminal SAM-like domain